MFKPNQIKKEAGAIAIACLVLTAAVFYRVNQGQAYDHFEERAEKTLAGTSPAEVRTGSQSENLSAGSGWKPTDAPIPVEQPVESDGPFTKQYDDGSLRVVGIFKNGKRSGEWSVFGPGNRLINTRTYEDGVLNGPYAKYYPNGQPSLQGEVSEGKREGTWTYFAEDGRVIRTSQYVDGALTGSTQLFGPDGQVLFSLPAGVLTSERTSEQETAPTSASKDEDCGCGV